MIDITDLSDRYAALVSIGTRAVVASLVEHEIEREYGTGDADGRTGATMLARAGIRMDWHSLWVQIHGTDSGLDAAADMHLRTMVREGLEARRCQCPHDGVGDHLADGHGHRGLCEGHYEADVPPVKGLKFCGSCYCATPEV
jgi:hypothetical protein